MGKVHDNERTFIAHLGFYGEYDTTCPSTGGLTVAYKLKEGAVEIGVSECSTLDRYNRELGRTIATGRLDKKPMVVNLDMIYKLPLSISKPAVAPHILSRILHKAMSSYQFACKTYSKKLGRPFDIKYRRGGHYLLTVWPDGETSYDTVSDC